MIVRTLPTCVRTPLAGLYRAPSLVYRCQRETLSLHQFANPGYQSSLIFQCIRLVRQQTQLCRVTQREKTSQIVRRRSKSTCSIRSSVDNVERCGSGAHCSRIMRGNYRTSCNIFEGKQATDRCTTSQSLELARGVAYTVGTVIIEYYTMSERALLCLC